MDNKLQLHCIFPSVSLPYIKDIVYMASIFILLVIGQNLCMKNRNKLISLFHDDLIKAKMLFQKHFCLCSVCFLHSLPGVPTLFSVRTHLKKSFNLPSLQASVAKIVIGQQCSSTPPTSCWLFNP